MASDFLPPGRLTLAASQINALEAPKATSRVLNILKCQVSVPLLTGRAAGLLISSALRIMMVLSLLRAWFKRETCLAVNTSLGFTNSPDPATITSQGTVTE